MFISFLRQPAQFCDGVEILDCEVRAVAVDDGCMHAACAVAAGQIVCRGKAPACFRLVQERKVLGVIVAVVCEDVEAHQTVQLLDFFVALRQRKRELHQRMVVQCRQTVRMLQKRRCGQHVDALGSAAVKALRAEITVASLGREQPSFAHFNPALLRALAVFVSLRSFF